MKRMIALLFVLMATVSKAQAEVVSSVTDGDTIVLENGDKIRLADIDAPESTQPYGAEAKEFLTKLVLGRDARLICIDRRSYGRKICQAYIGSLDVQKDMVGWGLAFDYPKFSNGKYRQAEQFAYQMKRGVWSGGVRPWDYRAHRKNH